MSGKANEVSDATISLFFVVSFWPSSCVVGLRTLEMRIEYATEKPVHVVAVKMFKTLGPPIERVTQAVEHSGARA